jgi:hypothetical protein
VWPFPLWADRLDAAAPCAAAACCAIATPATMTAVLHHQSRCDGRQTAIGMPSAVTLPDRPHCRCTALSGALTISGCHPRQDPPPVETPPAFAGKVQTNLSDQSVQPCFQFSPHRISISHCLVLGFHLVDEQPQRLAQKLQRPHLCAVGVATRSAICSSFSMTRSARESRCMRCSAVFSLSALQSWAILGCVPSLNASRWTLAALMFAASYASRYASLKPLPPRIA